MGWPMVVLDGLMKVSGCGVCCVGVVVEGERRSGGATSEGGLRLTTEGTARLYREPVDQGGAGTRLSTTRPRPPVIARRP